MITPVAGLGANEATRPVGQSLGLHGLLPVYKPVGMVSKDVSRRLTRLLGKVRMGHVGTLDPMAEGVLPIVLGAATRLQDYLLEQPKTYEFDLVLGYETTTLDTTGEVTFRAPCPVITDEDLSRAAATFKGAIDQEPPLYSAVKFNGRALYKYARANEGEAIPLESLKRRVTIHQLTYIGRQEGAVRFRVTCSRGTYVRVLGKQIAQMLGTYGTVCRILRAEAAGISTEQTLTLEHIEAYAGRVHDLADQALIPIERLALGIPVWVAPTSGVAERLRMGQAVAIAEEAYLAGMGSATLELNLNAPSMSLDATLVLHGPDGKVFGLGLAKRETAGRILISMKRGLL